MFCSDHIIIAILDFSSVMLGFTLLALTVMTAAFPTESSPVLHIRLDRLIVGSDIGKIDIFAFLIGYGITDILATSINAFPQVLCIC